VESANVDAQMEDKNVAETLHKHSSKLTANKNDEDADGDAAGDDGTEVDNEEDNDTPKKTDGGEKKTDGGEKKVDVDEKKTTKAVVKEDIKKEKDGMVKK
jgi:hypothetical protein